VTLDSLKALDGGKDKDGNKWYEAGWTEQQAIDNAKAKIKRKGCDWILANDVSPATGVMGGDRNTIHLLTREGGDIEVDSWPVMTKEQVAIELVSRIAKQVGAKA
jgi:phosphopantothenoylcysteine decarboxylase/phosphopantothenate--cysteine ligase